MPVTPTYGLPYQGNANRPDGPELGRLLSQAVETELARIDAAVAALQIPVILTAYKSADETVTNQTTYQDDDHLSLTVAANAIYTVDLVGIINPPVTAKFKAKFLGPTGATGAFVGMDHAVSPVNAFTGITLGSSMVLGDSAGAQSPFRVWGTLTVAGTAGTFKVQWAQNTATATGTIFRAQSRLTLRRLS